MSFFSNNFEDLEGKQFCRTCLLFCDTFRIDTFKFDNTRLKTIVQKYTNIEVNDKSIFPKTMCKMCIRKMYSAHYFLKQCHNSEIFLKSAVTENDSIENCKENDFVEIVFDDTFQNDGYPSDTDDNNLDEKTAPETKVKERKSRQSKRKEPLYFISSDPKCFDKYKVKWPDPPPYICKSCNKYFDTKAKLLAHKKEAKHKRAFNYICPYCKKRFSAPSLLLPHLRTHTREKPLKCTVCPKQFRERSILLRHIRTHSDVKPYVCQQCGNGYTRSAYLRDHIRCHVGLVCKFCGEDFESGNALSNHERTHLMKNKRLLNFYTNDYRTRVKKKHQFTCEICGKIIAAKRALEEHVAEHGPKTISCDHCDKKFASQSRKLTHVKMVHVEKEDKTRICDHCGRSFNKYVLKDHLRTHSEDSYCKVCDKSFILMSSYEMHRRLHNGNPETFCKVCNRSYTSKQSLRVHMQSHGEWQYACEKCNKKFFDEKSLKRHKKKCTRPLEKLE